MEESSDGYAAADAFASEPERRAPAPGVGRTGAVLLGAGGVEDGWDGGHGSMAGDGTCHYGGG